MGNLEIECEACLGSGWQTAPEWREWRAGLPCPTVPEEIGCGECDGYGTVLTPLGLEVIAVIQRRALPYQKRNTER